MIVLKENQRLYLHSCNYNMARMMSALASLVKEHGGRVKPTRQALISDRNCKDAEPIKVTHADIPVLSSEYGREFVCRIGTAAVIVKEEGSR